MALAPAPKVKKTKNGAKHTITTVQMGEAERVVAVATAAMAYQRAPHISREDQRVEAQKVADTRLFSKAQVAKIIGVSPSTITRWGVHFELVDAKKMGGSLNPAHLMNVVKVLKAFTLHGTFEIQHIRVAYEGGFSSVVLARLLDISPSYVMKLVRMAQNDHDLLTVQAPPGRGGHTGARMAAQRRLAEREAAARHAERWALIRERKRRSLGIDGLPLNDPRCIEYQGDSVPVSGAAADEAGRPDGVESGAEAGTADRGGERPEAPERSVQDGSEPPGSGVLAGGADGQQAVPGHRDAGGHSPAAPQ